MDARLMPDHECPSHADLAAFELGVLPVASVISADGSTAWVSVLGGLLAMSVLLNLILVASRR